MRSVNEIVIAVKESQPVTEQELRYCVLALAAMEQGARRALSMLVDGILDDNSTVRFRAACLFQERGIGFKSRKMPVDEYLGPGNIPGNPEYEDRMRLGKKIFKNATGLDL